MAGKEYFEGNRRKIIFIGIETELDTKVCRFYSQLIRLVNMLLVECSKAY